MARPIFSGHESFACKSHWLKRGYDFVIADRNFNDDDAVVHLGVGKNMVASIRFWLKAVGLLQDNELNPIADYLFNDENGQDPYIEDIGTLWLLHFMLVNTQYATIYKTTNRIFLGYFANGKEAVREAKKHYSNVDGCFFCCPEAHTR